MEDYGAEKIDTLIKNLGVCSFFSSTKLVGESTIPLDMMNTEVLSIVAIITAVDGQEEFIKEEVLKLVPITRQEAGCISYNLHQDKQNSSSFVFYENWTNAEALKAHLSNTHMQHFVKVTEGALAEFKVIELSKLS